MRFLVAGTGSAGRRHIQNLQALGERDILLFRSGRSTLPPQDLEGLPVFENLDEALTQRPDAVIVANPTACHLDVAVPAARCGCHLLLEKPVSHSRENLQELAAALESGGGSLLVGFQFRFHPTLLEMAHLVQAGAIGPPLLARAEWGEYLPDWHPWEDYRQTYAARPDLGGGVARTLCHPFDYLSWILGSPTRLLWGYAANTGRLGVPVEEVVEAGFTFASGALASIHLDYLRRPPSHRLEITGSEGLLTWNARDGLLTLCSLNGSVSGEWAPPAEFERNQLFLDEMAHFLAVVRNKALPRCTLDDGIRALDMSLSVLEKSEDASHYKGGDQ